ncbi:hypothetical protein L7F22_032277 [Adiantum nelumboides]|nr:hypothetical protein [Adiantum nelumboides]
MEDKLSGHIKNNKKIMDTGINAILIRLSKMEKDMETWQKEKEEWEKARTKWEEEKIAMQAQLETMKEWTMHPIVPIHNSRDPLDLGNYRTIMIGHTLAKLYGAVLEAEEKEGIEWVLFFQDTNGLLFKAIPPALGVSAQKDLDVNSLAVPRKAKEAIGGICRLTHENGTQMVINVEYNQLDPLLRATGHLDGDVNDASGFSPYPGNINQLIIKLGPYMEELAKTNGAIKEFVNPKYKDASKTTFKSSTRLECMMQDYPRTLSASAKVGFTVMDAWLAYAPVKNNPEDAAKVPKGNPTHSATTGEMAIYKANSLILRHAGVEVEGPTMETFNGQEVQVWPRIVWSPDWGLTYSTIKRKLFGTCSISQKSTLVLDGKEIVLDSVNVDGTLVLSAVEDAKVKLCTWRVKNSGWAIEPVDHKDTVFPEEVRLRGFTIKRLDQEVVNVEEVGNVELRQQL